MMMFKTTNVGRLLLFSLIAFTLLFGGCAGNVESPASTDMSPYNTTTGNLDPTPTAIITNTQSTPIVGTTGIPATSTAQLTPATGTTPTPVPTKPSTSLPVQDIARETVVATKNLTTLRFDMDFTMVFGLGVGEEMESMNMHQIARAAINIPDKKMVMTMDMVIDMAEEGKQNMSAEIYTVDGWMYMRANVPYEGDQWSKMKLTDDVWAQQSQLSSMSDFLKSPAYLELSGSEIIRGIDCYVLSVSPNEESLADWMSGQMPTRDSSLSLDNLGISQLNDNFTVKQWISKDGYLPVRQTIAMKFGGSSPTPTAAPDIFDQMAMEINATIDYYDYNNTVSIELPPEALNAPELTVKE
jgi:hypothetical protein